ncbi:hypothetical protein ON010_g9547 [Phytophthora cinnamomi]|nr:hypothetical protein ON010_g9547 [Phytophthora cinnamomi]
MSFSSWVTQAEICRRLVPAQDESPQVHGESAAQFHPALGAASTAYSDRGDHAGYSTHVQRSEADGDTANTDGVDWIPSLCKSAAQQSSAQGQWHAHLALLGHALGTEGAVAEMYLRRERRGRAHGTTVRRRRAGGCDGSRTGVW